jgi:hypothetical protein
MGKTGLSGLSGLSGHLVYLVYLVNKSRQWVIGDGKEWSFWSSGRLVDKNRQRGIGSLVILLQLVLLLSAKI